MGRGVVPDAPEQPGVTEESAVGTAGGDCYHALCFERHFLPPPSALKRLRLHVWLRFYPRKDFRDPAWALSH